MLKDKMKFLLKQYLIFITVYFIIAFVAFYFMDNKLILNKDNLFVALGSVSGIYLFSFLITYFKYK